MGRLVDGKWHDEWYDTESTGGRFNREASEFRHWVTPEGQDGPNGQPGHSAEPGRYHLYVSLACPWAHRTLIFRELKGLESLISLSVVHWYMGDRGWTFADGDGVIKDPVLNADYLYEIYQAANPDYTGRVTVPVLWDKSRKTIVNNESADIIRMFNFAFDSLGATDANYYPAGLSEEIDSVNKRVYENVNNGVYKAGFATTQEAYEEAVEPLFDTLDWLDDRLSQRRYLVGDRVTEADWRLFTTLVRFDPVYVGHFKCNKRRVVDYTNLWPYLRDLYQYPGVAKTVNLEHIKSHYYRSHERINPSGIVPIGPSIRYDEEHDRTRLLQ